MPEEPCMQGAERTVACGCWCLVTVAALLTLCPLAASQSPNPAAAPRQPISRAAAQPMLRNTQSTPAPGPPLEVDITALTDMAPPAAAAASPEAAIGPASAAPLLPRTTAMAREPMPATAVPLDSSQPSMSDPVGMVAAVGPVAEEPPPAPPQVADASLQAQPPPSLAPYPIPLGGQTSDPAEAEEGELRLVGRVDVNGFATGGVQVFLNGAFGAVCTQNFGAPEARIACRQLGFPSGVVLRGILSETVDERTAAEREIFFAPFVLGALGCSGEEERLVDCPLDEAESRGCSVVGDSRAPPSFAMVACGFGTEAEDGAVRLSRGEAGPDFEYGRLEVFLNGLWGDICSEAQFTPASAAVACRLLGYEGGSPLLFEVPYVFATFGVGVYEHTVLPEARPVALADVDCVGNEASLLDCPSRTGRAARCVNSTDATIVACGNTAAGCNLTSPEVEGSVRLVNGFGTPCDPLHTGTVEVFHASEWGAICVAVIEQRDPADTLAADAVCRQLGFPHGNPVSTLIPVPPELRDSQNFLLEDLVESGAPGRVWLEGLRCRGGEQSVLDCELDPPEFVNDAETCFGAGLASFADDYSSTPGTIPLQVACRQFAVEAAAEAVTSPGAVEGDIWLAGNKTVGEWVIGKPELFFEGSWHQVCAAGFDERDATVACRQLGL
eukprot:jgi/Ulvmu1/11555/UM078_0048.1